MNPAMMHNTGGFVGGVPGNMQQQHLQQQKHPQPNLLTVIQQLLQQNPVEPGWRQQVDLRERLNNIKQMYVPRHHLSGIMRRCC